MSGTVASALFETKGGQGSLAVPGKGKRQVVECFSCELLFPKKRGEMLAVILMWVKVNGDILGSYSCEAKSAELETWIHSERGDLLPETLKSKSAALENRELPNSIHMSSRTPVTIR